MDRYGRNKYRDGYASQRITLRRPDGTRLQVLLFSAGATVSFDQQHWAATTQEALARATHLYDAAWGTAIANA